MTVRSRGKRLLVGVSLALTSLIAVGAAYLSDLRIVCRFDGEQMAVFAEDLLQYQKLHGRFPTTEEGVTALVRDGTPPSADDFTIDSWGHEFAYRYPARITSQEFDLYSLGGNGIDERGAGDDIIFDPQS